MSAKPTRPIVPHKARFLLEAGEAYDLRSFADLGGSWGVHGGYSVQALLAFPIEHAVLVDDFVPEPVRTRLAPYPQLQIVKGAFGLPETVAAVPEVDAVLLFDILLHQVAPDWGRILEFYAPKARHLLIYNQQWTGSNKTVRLTDMAPEDYVRNTPFAADEDRARALATVKGIYAGFGTPHTNFGGKDRRDCPDIWQWGITGADLVAKCQSLGFRLDRMQNYGRFAPQLESFENHGFWFTRI